MEHWCLLAGVLPSWLCYLIENGVVAGVAVSAGAYVAASVAPGFHLSVAASVATKVTKRPVQERSWIAAGFRALLGLVGAIAFGAVLYVVADYYGIDEGLEALQAGQWLLYGLAWGLLSWGVTLVLSVPLGVRPPAGGALKAMFVTLGVFAFYGLVLGLFGLAYFA